MPYESFKCSHHVSIRGLVQDRQTGSWRYLIKVKRVMQDDTPTSFTSQSSNQRDFEDHSSAHSRSPSSLAKALWQRRSSSSFMNTTTSTSPTNSSSAFGYSQVYSIRRSFSEFKLLHAAMKPLMKSSNGSSSKNTLPSLPVDSIFAFFVGETQTMLQKKRLALENILIAIENHSAAADSSEYLEFLAKTDTYEQVSKAPISPPSSFTSSCSSTAFSLASTTTASSSTSRADTEPSRTLGLSEFTTSREAETHRIPTRAYHSNDQQHQRKKRRGRGTRRQSVAEAKQTTTEDKFPPARENRVDFHRYSLC